MTRRLSAIVALAGCALVNLIVIACIAGIVYIVYLAMVIPVPVK